MKRGPAISKAVSAVRKCLDGVLRHILHGADEKRSRGIRREAERVVGQSDGNPSDEIERRIEQRFMRNSWF